MAKGQQKRVGRSVLDAGEAPSPQSSSRKIGHQAGPDWGCAISMTTSGAVTAAQVSDYVEFVTPLTAQFLPPFFKLASIQPGERVLDLGCGAGDSTFDSARRVGEQGEVLGIDTSPEFIALARRKALEAGVGNARFEVMDACSLDLPDSYWDVVIGHLSITEFSDPRAALAEIQRVLRPVGRVALSAWGEWSRSPWLAAGYEAAHSVIAARPTAALAQPFRYGEPGVLSNLLANAGYQDVTPDRVTASLEYDTADAYWQAIERGLAYDLNPLRGMPAEQRAAAHEAGEAILRKWRYPRQQRLRLPAQAFLGVAVK